MQNCKINVDTSSSTPYISISVFCDAKILTVSEKYNYSNPKDLENLSNKVRKHLKENIENYLNNTTLNLDSDIANFSKHAIINFLTFDDWTKYNWISKYKTANFAVNINLNISSSLLFSGSQ